MREILKCTSGRLVTGDGDCEIINIATDSRTIKPSELFVAIKGANFDGHNFIQQALDSQAAGLLISQEWFAAHLQQLASIKKPTVIVEDTIVALGKIAHAYRQRFNIPIIAVTGSNGKTTTKEMTAAALSAHFAVLKSQSSFNNHIGVPLTLLKLNPAYQVAVLEMGMNHQGEIRCLSEIACPNIAVITNASYAHLEFFKRQVEIIRAKCELLEKLTKNDLTIINADNRELYTEAKKFASKLIGFGIKEKCQYQATDIINQNNGWEFRLNGKDMFRLNMLGRYNIYNALAAIAVSDYLGIEREKARLKLNSFNPTSLRMQSFFLNGIQIIADCYNANPGSMEAAINTLSEIKDKKRRILVFGDMLELGNFSRECHEKIGKLVAGKAIDILIAVGTQANYAAQEAKEKGMPKEAIFTCITNKEASQILSQVLKPEDVVLLKGSRKMRLEEIITELNFLWYRKV